MAGDKPGKRRPSLGCIWPFEAQASCFASRAGADAARIAEAASRAGAPLSEDEIRVLCSEPPASARAK